MSTTFEKITRSHKQTIFSWLAEPHIQEFWDNSQDHKDDILKFMDGRKEPSSYADGKYVYWVAKTNEQPFAMLMTLKETPAEKINGIKLTNLSKTGNCYGIDYMIGDKNYLGKGYGAKTLSEFIDFFRSKFDPNADTFLIDPAIDNSRAKHVYMKAGFKHVGDFIMSGNVSGRGKPHHLLIKELPNQLHLLPANIKDYPLIQNMARFYVYDLSRDCGHTSSNWAIPSDGLYQSFDFKNYFEDETRKAFLVKVHNEIAGFVLLNQVCAFKNSNWNVGEFFILAKFQGLGIGKQIAYKLWNQLSGIWEVSVIPENKSALSFWHHIISDYTKGQFKKEIKTVDFDKEQPKRIIFIFNISTNIDLNKS